MQLLSPSDDYVVVLCPVSDYINYIYHIKTM